MTVSSAEIRDLQEKHSGIDKVHHPLMTKLISNLAPSQSRKTKAHLSPGNYVENFIGVLTCCDFINDSLPGSLAASVQRSMNAPAFDEEYFEWLDIIEAIENAQQEFVMIELGAGYGRWSVIANAILQLLNPMPAKFVAVEAEPTHFKWLNQHFRDNDLKPKKHWVIEAAVAPTEGLSRFHIGEAAAWYGQALDNGKLHFLDKIKANLNLFLEKINLGMAQPNVQQERGFKIVKTITLNSILEKFPCVDLIDLDVQGAELDILAASIQAVNDKVKRLHIGTHSEEIEAGLEKLFHRYGWKNTNNYSLQKDNISPYGMINFGDGVQSWLNPKFEN